MRRIIFLLLLLGIAGVPGLAEAASGRVFKVLPHLLDQQGRHTLSPSLYERDAYQAYLRERPAEISGIRYDVQWKAKGRPAGELKLRLELRGIAKGGDLPDEFLLEQRVEPGGWLSRWTGLALSGEDYKNFGQVTAWRVSLWEGEQLLGEQKSFLW